MTTVGTIHQPPQPKPCERCQDPPLLYFDEKTNGWDCVHICGDRLFGAINQPSRDAAVIGWNDLN